jgi:GTP-binding protein
MDFRYLAEYRAERGSHGAGRNKTGRQGDDLILRVPPGTEIRDEASGELLGELLEPGETMVVAKGGRGGRGNARFVTSTQQAPTRWEPGTEGEVRQLELTLKLMADVGLVGEPNAGKSTLLTQVSKARPKVADYPFTTRVPNLGVVPLKDFRSFVLADIPGIIEGAAEGRGLGHQFLRHIERTRILAVLVPVDAPDPQATYAQLLDELARYRPELAERPHCLVLTKTDLLGPEDVLPQIEAPGAWGTFAISAPAHQGLEPLLEALWRKVQEVRLADGTLRPETEEAMAEIEPEGPEQGLVSPEQGIAADGTTLEDEEEWWGADPL